MPQPATQPATQDVLVVDDNDELREVLTELLSSEGYVVASASNGREALNSLRSGDAHPRLILLDLTMPVMDGWEFCAESSKDPILRKIPIGVVSATGPDERPPPFRLVDAGYFPKPTDCTNLLRTVASYCGPR